MYTYIPNREASGFSAGAAFEIYAIKARAGKGVYGADKVRHSKDMKLARPRLYRVYLKGGPGGETPRLAVWNVGVHARPPVGRVNNRQAKILVGIPRHEFHAVLAGCRYHTAALIRALLAGQPPDFSVPLSNPFVSAGKRPPA